MKIGNPADKSVASVTTGNARTPTNGTGKAQETGASDPSAKVELSKTASSLLSSNSASSDFDADKVARISQAIADGKFEINAEKIADRLISNAQEVLGKTH